MLLSSELAFTGLDASGQRVVGFTLGFGVRDVLQEIWVRRIKVGQMRLTQITVVIFMYFRRFSLCLAQRRQPYRQCPLASLLAIAGIARRKLKESA